MDRIQHLEKIQLNYILSKNRSGSTLLSNLLNTHPQVISISEENIYWKLKKDYGHYTSFTTAEYEQFLNDLFFLFKKPRNFSRYLFPSKKILLKKLTALNKDMDYESVCKYIYSQALTVNDNGQNIKQIINKEIHFSHLVEDILKNDSSVKIIYLTRNYPGNIYAVTKNKMAGKANYVYQAKKWDLEMSRLIEFLDHKEHVLHIKYRDLIKDTENTLKKIYAFLGLPYDPSYHQKYQGLKNKEVIHILEKNHELPPETLRLLSDRHKSTLSSINTQKVEEWKTQNVYSKKQLALIDYICKDTAEKLGYEYNDKKVSLSLTHRYYLFLAWLGDFVSRKYLLLPVQTKRFLRRINFFNVFNK